MFIDFEKWHGAKNDFVVTWILPAEKDMLVPTLQRLAPKICARDGSGISADGLLVMIAKSRKDPLPIELVIINSDGSLATNCGNGLRCASMSARRRAMSEGILDFDGVSIPVGGHMIDCRFLGKMGHPFVAVTMPIPKISRENAWHAEVIEHVKKIQSSQPNLRGDSETVDLGNPHVVLLLENATIESAATVGKNLQCVRSGDGINVHLASPKEITPKDLQLAQRDVNEDIGELYTVVPWERGVGPTQACGTGACAVGVTVLATGLAERALWVGIDMPGGRLYVKQDGEGEATILAGPAEFVFSGRLEI